MMVSAFCDCIAWIDIILKLFVRMFLNLFRLKLLVCNIVGKCIFALIFILSSSKLFVCIKTLQIAYHDNRGILITDRKKCLLNYLSKAFILDLIGALPWFEVLRGLLTQEINDDATFLINTVCKFAHIYILFAYFQYISDTPMVKLTYIMVCIYFRLLCIEVKTFSEIR